MSANLPTFLRYATDKLVLEADRQVWQGNLTDP
jgi:hypothetical protein